MLGQRFIRSTGQILMLPIILRPITLIMTKLLLSRLLTVPPSESDPQTLFFFSPNDDSSMFVMITRSRAKPPNHLCMTLIDCCSPVGATPFRRPRWLWVAELRRLSKAYIPWSKDLSVAATLSWQQCECTATSCIFNHLYYGRIVEWPLILLIECAWAVLAGDRCRRKLVYWSMSEPDDGFLFQLLHAAAGHRIH